MEDLFVLFNDKENTQIHNNNDSLKKKNNNHNNHN